ncbi:tRNA (adenosine(37)-N6)-threonylcarbamoyltransferase complex dimerization subunit type 1 TsaB [Thiorhodococcus mannitoliphagus]|uniref:tRNA threonylcarbamoyladenosine biosynthesis protein TsaB n=1 Tax=Thiorhodococcus mannitoliphagus TaxID=329406 RepID=A0A6P1DVD3_9GAMM|nr:tRNA (adenosine(37)-N6)-threonylcarbamoyltransferase complex dimerization subunit type 1 TsaB [Thiorhodococcus mannitoliphagus]NEX21163.1 tRNA (adenosine(37)-N6)-threonylcarbamoyltransferase complex dimerization subunit type 1 TsaB [Thiorhodococcus mannitoliphagus]
MKLLAIDTSGDACSAALLVDDRVQQELQIAPRRHGELILSMMQSLLDDSGLQLHELDGIAFGRGPGSFTGVRIAASVTQGAAFAADLPVIPISTLAAMAQGQFRRRGQRRLLAALDARMDEVYWGCYQIGDAGLAELHGEECVCPPDRAPLPPTSEGWAGVGPGWSAYQAILQARMGGAVETTSPEAFCEARDIATLAATEFSAGRQLPPEQAIPIYLRDQVTRTA